MTLKVRVEVETLVLFTLLEMIKKERVRHGEGTVEEGRKLMTRNTFV